MSTRTESTVTTIRVDGENGERYVARIEEGNVDLQVQTVETYASVRLPLTALPGFTEFLAEVAADDAAQPSTPVEEEPVAADEALGES